MANWCSTHIRIWNNDEGTIRNLESEFTKAFENQKIENGFGNMWLGNILSYLGYDEKSVLHGDVRCRGEVTYMELNENELCIDTETAWSPMLQVIMKMVEKYAPDSEVTYEAVEPGCGIFSTNDASMVGKIYVDIFDNLPEELAWLDDVSYSQIDKDEFLKDVGESMGWSETGKELIEKIDDELSDLFSYNEWGYAEIDEW